MPNKLTKLKQSKLILYQIMIILKAIETRWNKILKQDGYFERVVPLYNDEGFRSLHFRLSRTIIGVLNSSTS